MAYIDGPCNVEKEDRRRDGQTILKSGQEWKVKKKGNYQELIQSNPTFQPQNQKGKKLTNRLINAYERQANSSLPKQVLIQIP